MRPLLIACSVFLFLALAKLPIGYYTFLRIFTTVGAIAVVISEFDKGQNGWVIVFGAIAIFFNPLIPVYLNDRNAWALPDVASGILFLIKAFTKTKPSKQ